MTPEQTRILIDHLDDSLAGKPAGDLERLIAEGSDTAQEWNYLHTAVDAVREAGLYDYVTTVRAGWKAEQASADAAATEQYTSTELHTAPDQHIATADEYTAEPDQYIAAPANRAIPQIPAHSGGIVRTINRYALRAACAMLILTGGSVAYKYVSVSSESLYSRYYTSFGLHTSRGATPEQPIVTAYNAKDWNSVISLAKTAKTADNQGEFLAGMADLELKQCDDAITHFEQVIAANAQAKTDYYQDDAEYYLAISWLSCKKPNQAMPLLEKIKADPHHQYHAQVAKMSFFDLRLAQYKESK